jgi:uncharacterized protein (DUF1697 family)
MKTYIALLRGINVSGHKIIKMELLRKMFEKMGFENVKTYIQSGNVVFQSNEKDISKLEELIRKEIEKEFGFDVHIKILISEELKSALDENPFLKDDSLDIKQHYFAFLGQNPSEENWEILKNLELNGELTELGNKVVFIHYPNGAGQSKLSNNLIENKLKVKSTMRNLNTSRKLLEMISN